MKGTTEARARDALKQAGLFVYKPPDDARNWKPCDFFTWQRLTGVKVAEEREVISLLAPAGKEYALGGGVGLSLSRWIEVKQVSVSALTLSATDIRPSQRAGIGTDAHLHIPYWLLIWWQHPKIPTRARWTCLEMTKSAGSEYESLGYHPLTRWAAVGSVNDCVAEMIA